MGEYVQKPPVVLAEQWDGTKEGVRKILGLLGRAEPRGITYRYTVEYYNNDEHPRETLEIHCPSLIKGDGKSVVVRPESWVALHRPYQGQAFIEILHSEEFDHQFRKVEDGSRTGTQD